jgi:hypothetical protein
LSTESKDPSSSVRGDEALERRGSSDSRSGRIMEKIAMVEVLTGEQMVGLMKEEDASQALICPRKTSGLMKEEDASQALICPRKTSRPAPLCI